MKTGMTWSDVRAAAALAELRERAGREGRELLQIVWDEADGYPAHAWGYVQWSLRPYELGDGSDGTTDLNIHLIALRFCQRLGLDYERLYSAAYEWREENAGAWQREIAWHLYEAETSIPAEINGDNLKQLLCDLEDSNNHSLTEVLAEQFTALGYEVATWWRSDDGE